MCLTVNRWKHWFNQPRVAKRDIRCYKRLQMDEVECLQTPYQKTPIGRDDIKHGLVAKDFQKKWSYDEGPIIIDGIHSYSSYTSALWNAFYNDDEIIVCAYIPKGTLYWIGKHHEYVSEKICFN